MPSDGWTAPAPSGLDLGRGKTRPSRLFETGRGGARLTAVQKQAEGQITNNKGHAH